ncbi:MAG: hypothetical protein LBK96_04410, partial [Prevotellaceae bacterium]|nr:hypothetical protein [Prevotellaceae bacterium]
MSNDYIPQADRKFLVWVQNLFAHVEANAQPWNLNPDSWKHIDPPMIQAYDTALAKAEDPNHGVADTLEKNETRDVLKTETRKYVNEHLKYNSLISDEERKHMGLPVRDRKPTPAREPDSLPVVSVKLPSPGVIELHVVDSKSGRRAKPEGVHGYEIRYAIVDAPATDWAQLVESAFSTR